MNTPLTSIDFINIFCANDTPQYGFSSLILGDQYPSSSELHNAHSGPWPITDIELNKSKDLFLSPSLLSNGSSIWYINNI